MGYGHLRAAHNIAEAIGTQVVRMDLPPMAGPVEAAVWHGLLAVYSAISKAGGSPSERSAARFLLQQITKITPLPSNGHLEPPNYLARAADLLTRTYFGKRLRSMMVTASEKQATDYTDHTFKYLRQSRGVV